MSTYSASKAAAFPQSVEEGAAFAGRPLSLPTSVLENGTGLFASLVSLLIAVYPIVDVVSKLSYATKIAGVVLLTNAGGVLIYRAGERRREAAR